MSRRKAHTFYTNDDEWKNVTEVSEWLGILKPRVIRLAVLVLHEFLKDEELREFFRNLVLSEKRTGIHFVKEINGNKTFVNEFTKICKVQSSVTVNMKKLKDNGLLDPIE